MKIQFKINTESENENVSNALSNLLNPLNKLKIFTKNGNVSVMSRELARISSPLVNNILKDVPCCTSTMIFIPDVSKASVDHVINILGTGKTYFNCSSLKQIQEEVKITATMLQIDFSNIKCVGESESRDYLADVDYSSNNKYNLKEDTTEYFEYDAEPFICLKKEYIDKSIKTEPIDTLKEISVDSSKKPQQSGTVKNDLENFYKSEEIDPKKMEKQDISFSANICDCTDNSDPSPPHSKDDTEPAIEISKVVSGKELRRSSRLTNSVSSILDASCFLRPADLRKSDNVDHNSIVYTEAVQGVQKEKEEKVSNLSHCNNCKICMTESNRKSMYDEKGKEGKSDKSSECGRQFGSKYNLTSNLLHKAVVHGNTKNFKCEYCNKSYDSRKSRMKHIKCLHSNTTFPCTWPDCGYVGKYMKSHIKSFHHFNCAHCKMRCDISDKKHHMETFHPDKLHSCHWPGCNYLALSKRSLMYHCIGSH